MNEDQYTSQTSFVVKRIGGPNWTAPQGANAPANGAVMEKMHFWDDGPDDQTVVERDYESLVGVAGIGRGKPGSLVRKLRAFDHFTAIVGKGREDAGTQPLMESANMRIRTYNMQDEQFAFHRALRSEEVRIQFRGDALDLSEFENVEVSPGEITIIPLGISHSVISIPPEDENFLPAQLLQQGSLARPYRSDQALFQQQVRDYNDGAQAGRVAGETCGGAVSGFAPCSAWVD